MANSSHQVQAVQARQARNFHDRRCVRLSRVVSFRSIPSLLSRGSRITSSLLRPLSHLIALSRLLTADHFSIFPLLLNPIRPLKAYGQAPRSTPLRRSLRIQTRQPLHALPSREYPSYQLSTSPVSPSSINRTPISRSEPPRLSLSSSSLLPQSTEIFVVRLEPSPEWAPGKPRIVKIKEILTVPFKEFRRVGSEILLSSCSTLSRLVVSKTDSLSVTSTRR